MVTADLPSAISIDHLLYKRANFTLGEMSLDVPVGQCVALVGGNGAGKSTLLRCIAGLISPLHGNILLSGSPVSGTPGKKKLSYLPERFFPPHYLTGHEFLDFHLGLCGISAKVEKKLLDTLCLNETMLEKPVRKLSKGTAQKLGLVAALSTQRPVLAMDEPFSGLDPEAREGLRQAIREYTARGNCVFFSTHQFESMTSYIDRLLVIHEGSIHFDGAPSTWLEATGQTSFELAFIKTIHTAATSARHA